MSSCKLEWLSWPLNAAALAIGIHALLRREGIEFNHKRIFRLYQGAGLAVKRRRKRCSVAVERSQLALPSLPNEVWSMDFISDALANGRGIKVLTIVDDFTKESLIWWLNMAF